jgi:hypothetical protein
MGDNRPYSHIGIWLRLTGTNSWCVSAAARCQPWHRCASMSRKIGSKIVYDDSDSDGEEFISLGTPMPSLEDDEKSGKKFVPVWKQEVGRANREQ